MADERRRFVVGAMTGTSIDGIDAVGATIDGTGLEMKARAVRHVSRGLGDLAGELRRAAGQQPLTAGVFADLAWRLGGCYADAVADAAAIVEFIDLVAVHGQTVVHRPPLSWQLLNPAPIAARFRCPVVYDLRQADLAAGGRGAPISPIADWVLFRDGARRRAVVNLGGFCNVTVLGESPDDVRGFDVCACNLVLDDVARRALGAPFDEGGRAAGRGRPDAAAAQALLEALAAQRSACRALGTGDEASSWVDAYLERLAPDDLAATAVDAVARCVAAALGGHELDDVIVAGGGTRNEALAAALAAHAAPPLRRSDDLGVRAQAREALAMAVLGALSADRVPISLAQVTGASEPVTVAGSWCLPD